jgi:exodeoxyribonuclease VII large subunit
MTQPISVSQALGLAKSALEQISLTIVGEVSELSDKPGYKAVYFTLSDSGSALSCLMWRNNYQRAGLSLRQGMLVEVSGVFTVYAAKGRMSFDVKAMRLAGEGQLRLRVAALAKKLEAEGLMSSERKRALPTFPRAIAIVTSPRGKAVHDVLRTLRRRYPLAEVLLCGVAVEGSGAEQAIISGLEAAQRSAAEVILLVRGGGSYEDLMPFNDEGLARAIATCSKPVVTGIGHEPDNSIADMVADFRASTPTAAAERVVPDSSELADLLQYLSSSLQRSLAVRLDQAQSRLDGLRSRPLFADAAGLFAAAEMQLEGAALRLGQSLPQRLQRDQQLLANGIVRIRLLGAGLLSAHTSRLELSAALLDGLSPLNVLGRGYSIVYGADGHVKTSVDKVDLNEELSLRLADGSVSATVKSKHSWPAQG